MSHVDQRDDLALAQDPNGVPRIYRVVHSSSKGADACLFIYFVVYLFIYWPQQAYDIHTNMEAKILIHLKLIF